jgi:hypothetical protein
MRKMRRANMSAVDTAWFYRLKKGKYRRCSPVPATKPVKAKFGSKDNEVRHHTPYGQAAQWAPTETGLTSKARAKLSVIRASHKV